MLIKNDRGFTLVEMVAALAIFAIGILGILALFPVGIGANKRADDLTTAAILAQLKMTELLYDRPRSILATGVAPDLGPYICWNGTQYQRIEWDGSGWTNGLDFAANPSYPLKNHPGFFWAAYRQKLHHSLYGGEPWYAAAVAAGNYTGQPTDATYRIDVFIFKGDTKPAVSTDLDSMMGCFYSFSYYMSVTNPM